MLKQYKLRNYHFQLIIYIVVLSVLGIMLIGSAKASVQNKQIVGFVFGMVLMIAISLMDYSFILKFTWLYYIGIILLLIMVQIMGESSNGSQRWVSIGGIRFQPSELAKIVMILVISAYFTKHEETINTIKTLAISFVIAGIMLALILKQPDTSTTLLCIFIFVVLLFISGLSYKIILTVIGICVPIGLVGISYIYRHAEALVAKHYQFKRIMAWLDPTHYSDTATQTRNSIIAIGSGQLWGKGLNNSAATSVKNADYILEPQTDFIFAVAGEELGFVGCAVIIILLLLIIIECLLIARRAKDTTGKLICCGMAALIGFQAVINICVATGLMPNTGMTLPFVSYGLTSLVSLFIGMGFVLNVGLQPKKY